MKSTIENDMAGMGCFSRKRFGKRMVIGCYSNTLMYTNLFEVKNVDRRYGEGVMSVSTNELRTCANHISDDLKDNIEKCCNG